MRALKSRRFLLFTRQAPRCFPVLLILAVSIRTCIAQGKLEVTFIDVGQADAILVTCPDGNHHLLIDAGDDRYPGSAQRFRAFMTQTFTNKPLHLEVAVASHEHADHIGSMEWVLKNFRVDTYVDNGDTAETALYANLLTQRRKQIKEGRLNYIKGNQNSFAHVDFCSNVTVEIFLPWASKPSLSDQNDRSVAVRVEYGMQSVGTNSFLFVGDIEGEAEKVMLNQFTDIQRSRLRADVLKVGHHASDTSSLDGFIAAVSPRIAIVSVGNKDTGTNARYKHPRLSTIRHFDDWFKNHPPPVKAAPATLAAYDAGTRSWKQQARPQGMWLTVRDGDITVTSNGKDLAVATVPAQKQPPFKHE